MANVHPVLSDLFFNYDHGVDMNAQVRTRLKEKGLLSVGEDLYRHSILESAKDFLQCYGEILNCPLPTAEDLAADFMRRI